MVAALECLAWELWKGRAQQSDVTSTEDRLEPRPVGWAASLACSEGGRGVGWRSAPPLRAHDRTPRLAWRERIRLENLHLSSSPVNFFSCFTDSASY